MRQLAEDLWVVETPHRAFGVDVERRMSVVRLRRDELLLYSPAPLTPQTRAALDEVGRPRFVLAASLVHGHRYMEHYRKAFPDVQLFAAPGLDRRRKDLAFDGMLGSVAHPLWSDAIDQEVFLGSLVPEVVLLHPASGTLILGDLLIGVAPDRARSRAAALAWRAEGVHGRVAVPRSLRLATRNRRAARRSVEGMLAWDFERIVLGHGPIVESGGRAVFERAMSWLR
jgi:Domain of unknown function (DUF4336)